MNVRTKFIIADKLAAFVLCMALLGGCALLSTRGDLLRVKMQEQAETECAKQSKRVLCLEDKKPPTTKDGVTVWRYEYECHCSED